MCERVLSHTLGKKKNTKNLESHLKFRDRLKGLSEIRVEMEDQHHLWTSSRSCWSFFNKTTDIQYVFADFTWDEINKESQKTEPPNGFLDVFMDLIVRINTVPPHTPITVVWNQHLPCYDSTFDNQEFKVFTWLSPDLTFK